MKFVYRFLANLIFIFHILYGLFLLVGWMIPEIRVAYLPLLIIWPLSWILLGYCPLTKIEFFLRRKYNQNLDPDTEIIRHYLYEVFKIKASTPTIFTIGLLVFAVLLGLYFIHYGFASLLVF